MKALIVALMAPVMMVFVLAGIQTIEWCTDSGRVVPWQAYGLLVCGAVWCVAAIRVTKEEWRKVNRFFTKLTKE